MSLTHFTSHDSWFCCYFLYFHAAVDMSLIVGISIPISFLFVCSLGVFVATYIIGTVKMRSKRSIHRHPAPGLEPSVYEMIETDQKAIDVKTNFAYETVTEKGAE